MLLSAMTLDARRHEDPHPKSGAEEVPRLATGGDGAAATDLELPDDGDVVIGAEDGLGCVLAECWHSSSVLPAFRMRLGAHPSSPGGAS